MPGQLAPMDPVEEIERAKALPLQDPVGWGAVRRRDVALDLVPGLSAAEIEELGAELDVRLPRSLRTLLEYTAGIDGVLRSFAAELDERFEFADLRAPAVGAGFSWGRYGPRTDVRRHGYERLFASAAPEQKPGFIKRLLGR